MCEVFWPVRAEGVGKNYPASVYFTAAEVSLLHLVDREVIVVTVMFHIAEELFGRAYFLY